ncbi:MAG: tRNA (N6-isopentenyl adenosine(37)-C2)-methylthiotransferase MiaB [Chloroflexi bacterium]|nr:tRNA (N6-isopentenyl adenosine(37)-C2)-methylthiotransferase MiaB [Chloroflexota bacterium]MYD16033.1 tRNA (N6-isopentenyl adenosine(37)-C2)-methylthiotransferase MiaB [Chloroflexota bacterium]MYJ01914.1 tRNA (N6-isopentenyl adenosine(37)-C2)-methylthiotransferase MiaB [Chloroflexota bacterium]
MPKAEGGARVSVMSQYHIWTVGCQVNTADSAKLAAGLRRLGMEPTDQARDADLIVLNTCAVRQHAEDKAQAKLGSLKHLKRSNPDLKIAVMGCMVGPHTARGDDPITRRFEFVDTWAQPQRFDQVVGLLDLPGIPEPEDDGGEFWPEIFPDETSPTAYVPVIEGCDKFCTYCIVPLRRGRERSRPIDEIAREIEAHTQRGVREVTLLGQTVEAYGKDQPPIDSETAHADLSDLMRAIHDLPNLRRIRQLTSYPPDMTDRILEGMAELPKVCEAFSLPVQAGSDDVLTNMRRGYSVAQFRDRVEKVRSLWPEVSISTDVIVGFPGESDSDFQETYDLLEDLHFDKVHVAAYSPRTGTYAQRNQPDDVPHDLKMERLHRVEELQREISFQINNRYLLRDVEVLLESSKPSEEDGMARLTGRTRTMKLVHFDAPVDAYTAGDLLTVTVTRVGAWSLQGQPSLGSLQGQPA